MKELQIEYISVDDLVPYENNARKHAEADVDAIAASIKEFGFDDPVGVWSDRNLIVEGHGRVLAAKKIGMQKVPIVRLDHLTDEQRRAYALAHNKTAELSAWNFDVLDEELAQIFEIDMTTFGFEDDLVDPEDIVEDDYDPTVPEEPRTKRGDIYMLGGHRLMCGDATSFDDVAKLMDMEDADLVVTDPPYNMGYEGAGGAPRTKRIINDNMPEEKFESFLLDVYTNYYTAMREGASIYVFYKELGSGVFMRKMRESGLEFKQELIWVKNQIVLSGSKYQSMYEPCLMGCKGKVLKWNGKRKQRSVIETLDFMSQEELKETIKLLMSEEETDIIREHKSLKNDLHPTMKPIRLLAKLIQNSSDEGDIVLDLFGGSGSTMIACEQLKRRCFMSELDPAYCDVIIDRWESFTGGKAILLEEGRLE